MEYTEFEPEAFLRRMIRDMEEQYYALSFNEAANDLPLMEARIQPYRDELARVVKKRQAVEAARREEEAAEKARQEELARQKAEEVEPPVEKPWWSKI